MSTTGSDIPVLPFAPPTSSQAQADVVVRGSPANTLAYLLPFSQEFIVQLVSVDVDCTLASGDTQVTASLTDDAGLLLARVRTLSGITAGVVGQCTLAPQLEDSNTLPAPLSTTDIQGPLWSAVAYPSFTIAFTASDPASLIVQARMWVNATNANDASIGSLPVKLAHVPVIV